MPNWQPTINFYDDRLNFFKCWITLLHDWTRDKHKRRYSSNIILWQNSSGGRIMHNHRIGFFINHMYLSLKTHQDLLFMNNSMRNPWKWSNYYFVVMVKKCLSLYFRAAPSDLSTYMDTIIDIIEFLQKLLICKCLTVINLSKNWINLLQKIDTVSRMNNFRIK